LFFKTQSLKKNNRLKKKILLAIMLTIVKEELLLTIVKEGSLLTIVNEGLSLTIVNKMSFIKTVILKTTIFKK